MADTYTQLYVQFVFAVKYRESLIAEHFREEVQKYITGIVQNNRHKMYTIHCMPDHTHVFVSMNPNQSVSSLVNDMKSNSSRWINERKFCKHQFNWQNGFGAFSYHKQMAPAIVDYVINQKEHHQKTSFRDEYLSLLKEFEIDFQEKYLFDFL